LTKSRIDEERLPLSVLVIARDEELNLFDCLHSVRGWADQVLVVVDPLTTDRTREIATAAGCDVVDHPFEGYAHQRDWALHQGNLRNTWILILDADERVAPELRRAIASVLADPEPKSAYAVRFRFIFYGRWIKHCWYGTWIIRLIRRDTARYEMRGVHEHLIVDGETGYLDGDLIHNDFKDMDAWIEKHNRYATLEATEMIRDERGDRLRGRLFGSRVERRRWIKDRLWNRLPLRPLWVFVYLYFVRLGLLDGALGFRFCVMHAIFDAFTTSKVWEARRIARHPAGNYYRELLGRELAAHPDEHAFYRE
jgi:glycosyltransferase involved in cell wall biosynthesis